MNLRSREKKLDGRPLISKADSNNITEIKDGVLNYNRLNPNLNFENFVVGKSNKIAFLSAKKISSQLSRYNPLFIYGGGIRKTHLINAIGLELKK